MLRKLRSHASPAMVVAVVALIVALGGTAIAATTALTGKQKKESGKIAGKVFSKRIGGASVAHATSADSATKANTATKATEAGKADTATKANTATSAGTADTATKADKAVDAEKFGGRIPAEYQRKLNAGCLPPSAIAGISNEGDVTCAFPVTSISANPVFGEVTPIELANGLRILAVCHDGGTVELAFQNVGGATAGQLGWISGTGAATVGVGQESLAGGSGEKDFPFGGSTVELRVVYAISNQVMNINVDARDTGSSCEVRGTVSTVSS